MDWGTVGHGVSYRRANDGAATLVVYGGYRATLAASQAWATALVDARLAAAGVGHVYAVQGPRQSMYRDEELANGKLVAHLPADGRIYVVAHSSGAYVAHELLALANPGLRGRIAYANLDGGGLGLTREIVDGLAAVAFVYARDPTLTYGLSQNATYVRRLAASFGRAAVEVTVPDTGCHSGAGWCLHEAVVTRRPANPHRHDVARDYGRDVTTDYLEALIAP